MIRILWILLLISSLTACSTLSKPSATANPPLTQQTWKERQIALTNIQAWQLSGKVGVIAAHNSGSASLDWTQQQKNYVMSLSGPLGAGSLTLKGKPGLVTLDTGDGKHASASTPEKLIAQQMGWNLPVSYIYYWIRGLPAPGSAAETQFDAYHRLNSLRQLGFLVEFQSYENIGHLSLPNRLVITSPGLKVKIAIHHWQL